MHIRLVNGFPEKFSIAELRREVSFSANPTDAFLAEFNVYPLSQVESPAYDPMTQNLAEGVATQQDGQWVQTWVVTQASAEEVAQRQAQRAAQIQVQRAEAYRAESDPLFFKSQRGEATQQEWLDKVAEIKARYPA